MAKLRYPIIFFLRLKKGRININLKTLIFSKVRVFTRRFFILGNIKISKFDYRFPPRPHYKRCLRDTISNKNTHIPFFRSKITSFQDGSERNETREREGERDSKKIRSPHYFLQRQNLQPRNIHPDGSIPGESVRENNAGVKFSCNYSSTHSLGVPCAQRSFHREKRASASEKERGRGREG